MEKVLITGATGQIGEGVLKNLNNFFDEKISIDLLKNKKEIKIPSDLKASVRVVDSLRENYDLAIHFACNSDIDFCKDPKNWPEVIKSNVDLTREVCKASKRVIFASSVYVFGKKLREGESWEEDEERIPSNVYGKSKLLAEDIVLSHGGVVLRLETMMGIKNKIMDRAKEAINGGEYFPFWTNCFSGCSYFPDFLEILEKVLDPCISGVYNVSGSGDPPSRSEMADIALSVYKEKGWEIKNDTFETETLPEPKRFSLKVDKAEKLIGRKLTNRREAVRNHILNRI